MSQPKPEMKQSGTVVPLRLGDDTALLKNQPKGVGNREVLNPNSIPTGKLGAGDTTLHVNFLSKKEADEAFEAFQNGEITFQQWYHMPDKRNPNAALRKLRRIKAALCNPEKDGRIPLYRFPVNDQHRYGETIPMPSALEAIRKRAAKVTGYEFNHAVVLLYRDGDDCIGFHKDKTLDLDEKAPIVSISLGAERPYVLRDDIRQPTIEQEFVFPHGALLALGPETNQKFYHSVRQLKEEEKTGKHRISLTFRKVATFRSKDGKEITGKGSNYDTLNWPETINGAHRFDTKLDDPLPEDERKAAETKVHAQAHAKAIAERRKKEKKSTALDTQVTKILQGESQQNGETLKEFKRRLIDKVSNELRDVDPDASKTKVSAAVGKFISRMVHSNLK
mmetsp:Transcript_26649/g.37099  ORF Transcript_26649/g.37099 Transcript_26649/m.37099 type:complete len:392 (+) Transcript_26649:43-1218(+)|eukprot:CAMPEP_0184481678 /NCGR_PEP_ID=MMETSP0113_2-20130426/3240_1 /TAXON_ID=91329 /ORGANISM="Norrisiella sphaerica, Strain BC52" /LENGTH=391 /DNA_ID=CAMNT_0026860951 /DNA_START=35 /DNA_END=1210 /DNA_ORIENTATION=+